MMNQEQTAFHSSFITHHSSFFTCSDNRVEYFHVAGAATEIAREAFADVGVGWLWRTFEQADGGQHHARRADAALRAAAFDHRALDVVQALAVGDALDGQNLRALGLRRRDETTVDQLAVVDDGASAALALAAALLRP